MKENENMEKIKHQQQSIKHELINELIEKNFFDKDIKVKIKDNPFEKMSEIILDFADPIFEECDNDEDRERMLPFCIIIWNLCLMPKETKKEELKKILDSIAGDNHDSYMFWSGLAKSLMFRKEMHFSNIRRLI
ncbi:MAG: hypothetical protein GX638_13410 [Crenarchaeota archaeon]|nr:hypothetical protein [Thermoproteota archaeon]